MYKNVYIEQPFGVNQMSNQKEYPIVFVVNIISMIQLYMDLFEFNSTEDVVYIHDYIFLFVG